MTLRLAALAFLATAAPANAAGWSHPASFPGTGEPVTRVAIAPDGRGAVTFMSRRGLVVATGDRRGHFTAPRTLGAKDPGDWSIAAAPGGAVLVAWEARDGIHAALRTRSGRPFKTRRVAASTGSGINGVQVAADPKGGWVVAERFYPSRGSSQSYRVRAFSLRADGTALGAPQELGLGYFGIDARPTAALAVRADGRAALTFHRDSPNVGFRAEPAVVSVRPHGGTFTEPKALTAPPGTDPRVGAAAGVVAFTRTTRCGDVGCFGAPALSVLGPDGTPGPPLGPQLRYPGRAFGPSAAQLSGGRSVLVFSLKDTPDAFSHEAPVRAVAIGADGRAGALQTLTSRPATEPHALELSGGRALVVWSGARGLGASLAGRDGRFHTTPAPVGPPPTVGHFNSTNRDMRAAGRHAIVAWDRNSRVRVSVRAF